MSKCNLLWRWPALSWFYQIQQAQMCSDPPKRFISNRCNHRQSNRSTVRLSDLPSDWQIHCWNTVRSTDIHPCSLIGQSDYHCSLIGQSDTSCSLIGQSDYPYSLIGQPDPSCSLIGQSEWAHAQSWWNSKENQNWHKHTHRLTTALLSPPFSAGNNDTVTFEL